MGSLFLVNHLDFSRSFEGDPEGATAKSIGSWLRLNWLTKRGGGVWNYTPAMNVLVPGFEGQISLEDAIAHCHRYWHPHGRTENEHVVRSYWRYVSENRSTVYKRKSLAAPIGRWRGRNIFIGIRAPLIRVAGDEVLAVMPIFRKSFVPNAIETNLSMTALQEFCFREGYRGIDTELIRAAGIDGAYDRRLIVDRGSERKLYSSDKFDAFVAKYVEAVSLLADDGLGLQVPNFKGYRIWDPDQPAMF